MLGGIIGDVLGSVYEHKFKLNGHELPLVTNEMSFTDDTVHMLALAETIITKTKDPKPLAYAKKLKEFFKLYPRPLGDYGGNFKEWAVSNNLEPYNSLGNGCLMRLAPVLWLNDPFPERLETAISYTNATHNHPDSIVAVSCMTAVGDALKNGGIVKDIKTIASYYGYKVPSLHKCFGTETFDYAASTTLPKALACICDHDTDSFEDVIRNAISIGGDVDTIACIAGTLAEFVFDIPKDLKDFALSKLDKRLLNIYTSFFDF